MVFVERFSRANVPHLPRGRELGVKRSGTKTRPTSTEGVISFFRSGGILGHFDKTTIFTTFLSGFTLTVKEIWLPDGTIHYTGTPSI